MSGRSIRESIAGPAGRLEIAIDSPAAEPVGIALVAHPHPLYGGTLENKVVYTLARAFVELGYVALRPNFRGVGGSEGTHDEGRGEVDDLACALDWGRERYGDRPVALAGFSFGAAAQTRLAARLVAEGRAPARVVLVGLAAGAGRAHPTVPQGTLVIHGEDDSTVPLAAVLDWARPQGLPVVVLPQADHFFNSRLAPLRSLVLAWQPRD